MSKPLYRWGVPLAAGLAVLALVKVASLMATREKSMSSAVEAGSSPIPPPEAGPRLPFTLSPLSEEPEWHSLAAYADTIEMTEFQDTMTRFYGDGSDAWRPFFRFSEAPASIGLLLASQFATTPDAEPAAWLKLPQSSLRPPSRFWRMAQELPASSDPAKQPLEGVKVAIDPGHIGGVWAQMEQRWYQPPGETVAVMEGEMTLITARLLQTELEALGATVFLVRDRTEPVTSFRASDFTAQVKSPQEAENYFYRRAEISARAQRINNELQPDLVVCLHFNAEPWGDPGRVTFVDANHLHLLVNGHYSPDELAMDDNRFEMLQRLFQRTHEEELRLADAVARSLAAATGLPPYDYGRGHMASNAHRPLPENPYVWARNLRANRLYQCPVVFTEPYVMNSREVYERVAAGDYEGEKLVAGQVRPSLYREYARGVAQGLRAHFMQHRPTP